MAMNKYLEAYVPMVDFLAKFLGKNTEVVLHDLTDWHYSVVAIRNGHITGREVGSPVTDLALQILNEAKYHDEPYMIGYTSRGKNGHVLKSATYFIRDSHNNIVGMLCINWDCQDIARAKSMLDDLIRIMDIPEDSGEVQETFTGNVNELIEANFRKVYPDISVPPSELGQREKLEIVSRLNSMGTFLMKGAVGYIAERLEVSIPTVYRYLNQIKNTDKS